MQELLSPKSANWQSQFATFTMQTLLRIEWVVYAQGKFLIVTEKNGAHGPYATWNYIVDENCFLANCMGLQAIERYFGIPPEQELLLRDNLEGLGFVTNNVQLANHLKAIHFCASHHRETINEIDCVFNYIIFDFGDFVPSLDIDPHHNPTHQWMSYAEIAAGQLNHYETFVEAWREYASR